MRAPSAHPSDALAASLLEAPIPEDDAPGERYAYGFSQMLLVSVFVAYHATVLLVFNTPATGPTQGLHWVYNRHAQMYAYLQLIGSRQTWGMFAPSPPTVNRFVRVLVEDPAGKVWDLKHDSYGRREFPSLVYDPNVKLNERLVDEAKAYHEPYAAWVCREWERTHGEPAREVRLALFWTQIPPPAVAYRSNGYHPMALDVNEGGEQTFPCATLVHGQLPDSLRRRYGLPPGPPGAFKDVDRRTWWTKRPGGIGGAGPGMPPSRRRGAP